MTKRNSPVPRLDRNRQGLSELLGIVLLFGIVLAGMALIFFAAMTVSDDIDRQNRFERAKAGMVELDNRIGSLSNDNAGQNRTAIDADFQSAQNGTLQVVEKSTSVQFTLNGDSNCQATVDLGAIRYRHDDGRAVVYEAGGVWELSDGEATMVQPPDFEFTNGTITFHADVLSGSITDTDTAYAAPNRDQTREAAAEFEANLLTGPNGIDSCMFREDLTITVQGPYYQAWADFFRQAISVGTITVSDTNRKVTVELAEDDLAPFDSDGDGTVDEHDNCPRTFNPSQRDTDGNGDGDACDPDDDGDGVDDDDDNCMKVANPDQYDRDGDDLGNVCDNDMDGDKVVNWEDNCWTRYNPNQNDTDGDTYGDACDPDDDNDGAMDPWDSPNNVPGDNCPRTQNPGQVDTDDGGRGNSCDPDDDGDGIPDDQDNCPGAANPDQDNEDGDNQGDVCDPDIDGDGVFNPDDNCLYTENPDQDNEDGDGLGDKCDPDNEEDDDKQPIPTPNLPSDDDADFRTPPHCDPDETPDYEDRPASGDPEDVPNNGCYPSEIPNYGPGDPPNAYTNVINVVPEHIEIDSDA